MNTSSTTTAVPFEWTTLTTVALVVVVCSSIGVNLLVLLVLIAARKRLMSNKTQFVPILNQSISAKQKAKIQDESELEKSFTLRPPVNAYEVIGGWYMVGSGEQQHHHDGGGKRDDLAVAIAAFVRDIEESKAGLRGKGPLALEQPQVPSLLRSRHQGEYHLGSLVVQSHKLVEAHASEVSPSLKRDPNQDVITYIRSLQIALQLSKGLCDAYVEAFMRFRWAGPLGGQWSARDFQHFMQNFRTLLKEIDGGRK